MDHSTNILPPRHERSGSGGSSSTITTSTTTSSSQTTTTTATTVFSTPPRNTIASLLKQLNAGTAHATPFELTTGKSLGRGTAKQVFPRFHLLLPGEPVAIDIEFQQYRRGNLRGGHDRLGWVGVVNTRGEVILECFVYWDWEAEVYVFNQDFSARYGVTEDAIKMENGAVKGYVVEQWLARILKGRDVVVHGGGNDRKCWFKIDFFAGARNIIDTQHSYGQVKLRDLADTHFDCDIQAGIHSPVEDATITMLLFLKRHSYARPAAYTQYQALSEAEKKAYLKTGPTIMPHCYQGNEVPGAPKPKALTTSGRGRGGISRGRGGVMRGGPAGRGRGGKKL